MAIIQKGIKDHCMQMLGKFIVSHVYRLEGRETRAPSLCAKAPVDFDALKIESLIYYFWRYQVPNLVL